VLVTVTVFLLKCLPYHLKVRKGGQSSVASLRNFQFLGRRILSLHHSTPPSLTLFQVNNQHNHTSTTPFPSPATSAGPLDESIPNPGCSFVVHSFYPFPLPLNTTGRRFQPLRPSSYLRAFHSCKCPPLAKSANVPLSSVNSPHARNAQLLRSIFPRADHNSLRLPSSLLACRRPFATSNDNVVQTSIPHHNSTAAPFRDSMKSI
jgi:hypothetical protein